MLLIAAAFVFDAVSAGRLSGMLLLMAGVPLALVPALVWLGFFYRRDRHEPEPLRHVLEVFIVGALVALAVGNPVLNAYELPDWVASSQLVHFLSAILIVGFLQESLKYLTLRFTVYRSSEFGQLQDGIVYGTAVGLGYVTALNLVFVMQSGGAELGPLALRTSIAALAHGTFGGIVGYFVAGQKLQQRPVWWSLLGLAIAALLNGVYFYSRALVAQGPVAIGGLPPGSWVALLASALGAATVAVVLAVLLRREDLRSARAAPTP